MGKSDDSAIDLDSTMETNLLQEQNKLLREQVEKLQKQRTNEEEKYKEREEAKQRDRLLNAITKFNGTKDMKSYELAAEWTSWIANVQSVWDGANIPQEQMLRTLMAKGGPVISDVFKYTAKDSCEILEPINNEQIPVFDNLVKRCNAKFRGQNAKVELLIKEFREVQQKQNESFRDFAIRLQKAAEMCQYSAEETQKEVRQQLIGGATNTSAIRLALEMKDSDEKGATIEQIINVYEGQERDNPDFHRQSKQRAVKEEKKEDDEPKQSNVARVSYRDEREEQEFREFQKFKALQGFGFTSEPPSRHNTYEQQRYFQPRQQQARQYQQPREYRNQTQHERPTTSNYKREREEGNLTELGNCKSCNGNHGRDRPCFAANIICHYCNIRGHFGKYCMKTNGGASVNYKRQRTEERKEETTQRAVERDAKVNDNAFDYYD